MPDVPFALALAACIVCAVVGILQGRGHTPRRAPLARYRDGTKIYLGQVADEGAPGGPWSAVEILSVHPSSGKVAYRLLRSSEPWHAHPLGSAELDLK
jgi:hypothetical protein